MCALHIYYLPSSHGGGEVPGNQTGLSGPNGSHTVDKLLFVAPARWLLARRAGADAAAAAFGFRACRAGILARLKRADGSANFVPGNPDSSTEMKQSVGDYLGWRLHAENEPVGRGVAMEGGGRGEENCSAPAGGGVICLEFRIGRERTWR